MGEVHDIATVGVLNDILSYDVSLSVSKAHGTYQVQITWIGERRDGSTGMGHAKGAHKVLFHALADAYRDMLSIGKSADTEETTKGIKDGYQ